MVSLSKLGRPPINTKAQRRLQRAGKRLGDVKPSTKTAYDKSLLAFFNFLRREGISLTGSFINVDSNLSLFIHGCWNEGDQKALAANAASGLQYYVSHLRGNLRGSWKLIGSWGKLELPLQAPPMHFLVMMAIAEVACMDGEFGFACALVLGFHCFLRSNEIFSLTKSSVVLGHHSRGAVILEHTKKGMRDIVEFRDGLVWDCCQRHLKSLTAGDLVIQMTPQRARAKLAVYISSLGLASADLRWYSVRRGGATFFFQQSGNMDKTLLRGRWECQRTAKLYITDGMLALSEARMTDASLNLFLSLARSFVSRLGCPE
jgi:hypothetical protein